MIETILLSAAIAAIIAELGTVAKSILTRLWLLKEEKSKSGTYSIVIRGKDGEFTVEVNLDPDDPESIGDALRVLKSEHVSAESAAGES